MQLYFLTSVGSSVDANGNLQFTDTAGNILAKFVSGSFYSILSVISLTTNSPITTTTSTTGVALGKGFVLPAPPTGIANNFKFIFVATVSNSTVGASVSISVSLLSGSTLEAGGTADTSTAKIQTAISATASASVPITVAASSTFLTLGGVINILARVSGGTGTIVDTEGWCIQA